MTTPIQNQQFSPIAFTPLMLHVKQHPQNLNDNLETIMSNSGIGVWSLNSKTMQINVCATFKRLLGLPDKSSYQFAELFRKVHFLSRDIVLHDLRSACNRTGTLAIEFLVKEQHSKRDNWFKLTGKIYERGDDERGVYMGTLTDITETKTKEIWNNDRLALPSHELKGPLSVIKLYVQRAYKISADENLKDAALFLNKADDQVNMMALLMDDFLTSATVTNAKMALAYEWFDVAKLVGDLIAQMQLKHPGYQLISKVSSTINMKADKRKITQVILNYLSNAVKYSPENSRIEIKCQKQHGKIKFAVKDYGIGINSDHQQKVFDRYYRTPGSNADGFGLGLYLVKEIINQHGGEVWVESLINQGSTFYFSIPASINTFKYQSAKLIQ